MMDVDPIDRRLLVELTGKGRSTWTELAEIVGLSPPAVAERVRRLEQRGLIRGYTALLNAQGLGLTMLAFVNVTLDRPADRPAFLQFVAETPEVQECHHLAGEFDYLLKVCCRDTSQLEYLITEQLKGLNGVTRTRTVIALSTVKDAVELPLPLIPKEG